MKLIIVVQSNALGSRSNDKDKYEKDIRILLKGIREDPRNTRYYFYLANSYYDSKDYKNAKFYYHRRIEMKGWDEEVYYSMYKYAMCKKNLQITDNFEEVLYDFLKAFNYRKTRLEALYEIVKYYRLNFDFTTAYGYGMLGYNSTLKFPNDVLFINKNIHNFMFIDELSVCAWNIGNYIFSYSLTQKLLNIEFPKQLEKKYIERFKQNKIFFIKKIKSNYNIDIDYHTNPEYHTDYDNTNLDGSLRQSLTQYHSFLKDQSQTQNQTQNQSQSQILEISQDISNNILDYGISSSCEYNFENTFQRLVQDMNQDNMNNAIENIVKKIENNIE